MRRRSTTPYSILMHEERFKIAVSAEQSVSAVRTVPAGAGWLFAYAPGAGSNIDDPFGVYACQALAALGFTTVRFQFPYMEAGRRGPDPARTLEAVWHEVIATLQDEARRIAVGGRSMGGRIASQVVAQGVGVDALCLFSYPLHPRGLRPSAGMPTCPRSPPRLCSARGPGTGSPRPRSFERRQRWFPGPTSGYSTAPTTGSAS